MSIKNKNQRSVLKDRFLNQTEIRLYILESWIEQRLIPWAVDAKGSLRRDSNGELVPAYTPSNLSEFCNWEWHQQEGISAPMPELLNLRKYSRTNFYQPYHSDLAGRVKMALKNISSCRNLQIEVNNKKSIVAAQKATIDYLEKVIKNQETESRSSRLALAKNTTEERTRTHLLRLKVQELERLLRDVEKRNAELTLALARITPLKSAK